MGWLNALLPLVSAVGQKMLDNYNTQSRAEAAERQSLLASCAQYPPKILDNYYSTSRIETILRENDVYGEANSQATRQYYRDDYYFAGTNWGQIFVFTPAGNLGKILLVHDWDPGLYSHICQTLGTTCSIVTVDDGEYTVSFSDDCSIEEWRNAITEVERNGLNKNHLYIVYADNWIFEYIFANGSLNDDCSNFIQTLPNNGRLITLEIDENGIILHFESAGILKNSQF